MHPSRPTEQTIFHRAHRLAEAARHAYLAEACGSDAALRARIEDLLRADAATVNALDDAPGAALRHDGLELPGARIGRYKLLQRIGEGGCGVVYMAEQEEPFRRRVALKVIKLGMDTREVIARFEAERQALARMDHPCIARVLDAGATESGRPFFVMELVRGVRITDFCDQNHLPGAERLRLFCQVCQAIDHAHAQGVVHRDIKPSNILVTVVDGVAVPKVIDFGIAKATEGRLTDQTLFTAFEQFIGTPAYMSPEQVALGDTDIDARSDVYSLGVLLYELLTGRPPFDPAELHQAGLDAMRQVIREVDPARPSVRLGTLTGPALAEVAHNQATAATTLVRTVRGDLDWIAMRCLDKHRARRYPTAAALGDDIRRYLEHRPVTARRPSPWYRAAKFARRRRTPLLVGGTGLLAAAALLGAWWMRSARPAGNHAAPPAAVGSRGDVDQLAISGNDAFSARALRRGLARDDDYVLAARFDAPLPELQSLIRQALLRGYRAQGYADAAVAVRYDPASDRIHVAITEGRKYLCGPVQLTGTTGLRETEVADLLAGPASDEPGGRLSRAVSQFLASQTKSGRDATPLTPAAPGPADAAELFVVPVDDGVRSWWKPGTPAADTDALREQIAGVIRRLLDERGRPLAQVGVGIVPVPAEGVMQLRVRVDDGPQATLAAIHVSGNVRNSAAEIAQCAGLAAGDAVDARTLAQAKEKLWSSARFNAFTLTVRTVAARDGGCVAVLDVVENSAMPPLAVTFDRRQEALRRLANWLTAEGPRHEIALHLDGGDLHNWNILLSPAAGEIACIENPATGALLALLLQPDRCRLYAEGNTGHSGLGVLSGHLQPTGFIQMVTTNEPNRHGSLSLGAGLVRTTADSPTRPLSLVVSPLALLENVPAAATTDYADGIVTIRLDQPAQPMVLRFQEDTGQLLTLEGLTLNDVSITVRVDHGDVARILGQVDRGWATLPFDPGHRISLGDLLLRSNLRQLFPETVYPPTRLRRAATSLRVAERVLALPEVRALLNPVESPDDPEFPVPPTPGHEGTSVVGSLMSGLHQLAQLASPSQTWPSQLLHLGAFLVAGEGAEIGAALQRLARDEDMGPVENLLTAKLLLSFGQPEGWRFARRAAERRALTDFRRDFYLFAESNATIARAAQASLAAVATLSNEEVDAISEGWPAADAADWREFVAAVRTNAKGEILVPALRAPAETWWERRARPQLAERIGRFLRPGSADATHAAAFVNGVPVNRAWVAALRQEPSLLPSFGEAGGFASDPALDRLAAMTAVFVEAGARGLDLSDDAVNRHRREVIRTRYHDSDAEFAAATTRLGLAPGDSAELLRLDLAAAEMRRTIGSAAWPDWLSDLRGRTFLEPVTIPGPPPTTTL